VIVKCANKIDLEQKAAENDMYEKRGFEVINMMD